jgi:cyanophycin synthetase
VIKIIHRRAGGVVGDGVSTISALVKGIQSSEEMRRNFRHYKRHILDLDEEALGLLTERGLNASVIPKAGELIPLRRKSNISSGGVQTVIGVDQAHPDNLSLAERATRCLALDLAGVDMLIPDISISWLESAAYIIEVNSSPQISIVDTPDIYKQIMQQLVSEGGHIPVHYRILPNEDNYPSEDVIEALRSHLQCHSCVSKYGVSIGSLRCSQSLSEVFQAMRGVTLDPSIESILVVLQFNDLQRYGLPTSRYESLVLWSSHDSVENAGFVKKIKDLLRLDGDTDIKIVRWTREDTK